MSSSWRPGEVQGLENNDFNSNYFQNSANFQNLRSRKIYAKTFKYDEKASLFFEIFSADAAKQGSPPGYTRVSVERKMTRRALSRRVN